MHKIKILISLFILTTINYSCKKEEYKNPETLKFEIQCFGTDYLVAHSAKDLNPYGGPRMLNDGQPTRWHTYKDAKDFLTITSQGNICSEEPKEILVIIKKINETSVDTLVNKKSRIFEFKFWEY